MPTLTYPNLGKPVIPWKPKDLFIYGNDGFWPDGENPADGRLFQDAAATLPATTFGQPVGLDQRLSGTANLQQATAAARPTTAREPKGGRRNLLTWTEDFSNAVWAKPNLNLENLSGGVWRLTPSTVLNVKHLTQSVVAPGGQILIYIEAKADGYSKLRLVTNTGADALFDLKDQTAVVTVGIGSATITPASNGFYLCRMVSSPTAGARNLDVRVADASGSASFAGDGISALIIRKPQVEVGAVATPYQKVASIYDVTEAGVPDVWSLRTDGVDDLMASTATFDVNKPWYLAVCAMIESAGGAGDNLQVLFGMNNGFGNRFYISARSDAGTRRLGVVFRSGGAYFQTPNVEAVYAYGVPFIVEAWGDGATLHRSINGATPVTYPYTPGSSPNLAPIQLAAGNGIAPTRYYDALAVQRVPSDQERAALRAAWTARYLP